MKRFMSLLLAFCLLFCFSVPAYATDVWDSINGYCASIDDNVFAIANYVTTKLPSIDNALTSFLTGWSDYVENHAIPALGSIGLIYEKLQQLYLQFKAYDEDLMQNYIPSIDSGITTAISWLESANGYLGTIDTTTTSIHSDTSTIKTDVNSLFDGWSLAQNPNIYTNKSPRSWFGIVGSKVSDLSNILVKSTFDVTNMNDSNFGHTYWYRGVYGSLYRLQQVLADDDDLQMRKDTEENRNSFKDNFLDSSADNSIKVSDITSVSSLSSGLKQNFDTGVNPLSLFDFLSDESPFSWFTEECKNSMVSVPSSNTYHRVPASSSPYGDYASEHMQDYYNKLEGVKK